MSKAYVLLSGGLDSSTLLFRAINDHVPYGVTAVSIDYGQKHSVELDHAKRIADVAGAEHKVISLAGIMGKGGLSDPDLVIPNVSYDQLEGVSPTYVPFRNGLMLSVLTSMAQSDPEAEAVYYGAHAEDAANWAYPDCTPEFIGAMANAIYVGTYHRVRLHTPYMWYQKWEIVKEGTLMFVPYEMTWSCYKGQNMHCGICPTCRARRDAFERAEVTDPTEYANEP